MSFRFENTAVFVLLWMIPALVAVYWISNRWARARLEKNLGGRLVPFLTRSVSVTKRRWKLVLSMMALALAIIALARPQQGASKQEIRAEGVEVVLLADVSESMLAEDIKPSRLEQAKVELQKLVDLMPGNKTGVVAFAGQAALLSPLTNDPAAVNMYLDSLSVHAVSSQGTCFECGLREAEAAFERGSATDQEEGARVTRVIVVVSDGEDHEQGALDVARALSEKGIKIFTIAYGTEKGGAIPVRDGMGFMRGYKRDRSGQTILSRVKGEFLAKLAEAGGGTFAFSTFGGDHLNALVSRIETLEKTQFDAQVAVQYDENFQMILLFAILLASAEAFLGSRRRDFRFWKGRYEVPPQ